METTATLRRHRGCCQCGRMKHLDGTPHGRRVEPAHLQMVVGQQARHGVSHGYCLECKRELWAKYGLAA